MFLAEFLKVLVTDSVMIPSPGMITNCDRYIWAESKNGDNHGNDDDDDDDNSYSSKAKREEDEEEKWKQRQEFMYTHKGEDEHGG